MTRYVPWGVFLGYGHCLEFCINSQLLTLCTISSLHLSLYTNPYSVSFSLPVVFYLKMAKEIASEIISYTDKWQRPENNPYSVMMQDPCDKNGREDNIMSFIPYMKGSHENIWNLSCDLKWFLIFRCSQV